MENLQVEKSVSVLDSTRNRVIFSLVMKSLLFAGFGGMLVGIFAIVGNESPLQAAEKWWPFQVLLANIATFFILKSFFRKEGIQYWSIFTNFDKGKKKKTTVEVIQLKRRKARRVCLCCPASSALASPVVKTVFFFAEIL